MAAEARLVDLAASHGRLTDLLAHQGTVRAQLTAELVDLRSMRRALAVESYVHGLDMTDTAQLVSLGAATDLVASQVLVDTVDHRHRTRQQETQQHYDTTLLLLEQAADERAAVRADIVTTESRRRQAAAAEVRLATERDQRAVEVAQARALAGVDGVDFPLVALDAYWRAARRLARERPGCGIGWSDVAGIARIESRHGTFRGTALLPDGATSRQIIGIPLDGTRATRLIADTDGGRLDGDVVVDRAVGPMQFIPSTWARWGRDGNGDGSVDPHNLYDAALAAAAYLCSGGRMTDDEGKRQAFLRYNRSEAYAAAVLGYAHRYAAVAVP
jgi:membrane-bound lytic murein transglycosylase B